MRDDFDIPTSEEVAELVRQSVLSDSIGVLWLDQTLVVRRRLGSIAQSITAGLPVGASLLALFGQEERLAALRDKPGKLFHLPNVTARDSFAPSPRLRITVHWSDRIERYVVVMSRVAEGDVRDGALEDELRKRRIADAALGALNQQLEEFVYIISHDLKEPMRAIRYLSGLASAALASQSPDLREAIARCDAIEGEARRMSAMLSDLLEYSRIGRESHEPEPVDLSALISNLSESHAGRSGIAIVATGPLPTLQVLRVPFELVVRNLLANGIKHHDRSTGRVEFSVREETDRWIIGVTDDGPGIPLDAQQDIFLPFRKLKLDRDVESTGIGLALVRRAVESVSGSILVDSDPSLRRGTRFEVVWPRPRSQRGTGPTSQVNEENDG